MHLINENLAKSEAWKQSANEFTAQESHNLHHWAGSEGGNHNRHTCIVCTRCSIADILAASGVNELQNHTLDTTHAYTSQDLPTGWPKKKETITMMTAVQDNKNLPYLTVYVFVKSQNIIHCASIQIKRDYLLTLQIPFCVSKLELNSQSGLVNYRVIIFILVIFVTVAFHHALILLFCCILLKKKSSV